MADVFLDCTTKDLERLQPFSNKLMVAFQAMQVELTKDMELRDQMIVVLASLEQLHGVATRVSKRQTTARFVRSIARAVTIDRAFGTGKLGGSI